MSILFDTSADVLKLKDCGDLILFAIRETNAVIEKLGGSASLHDRIILDGDSLRFVIEMDLSLSTLRVSFEQSHVQEDHTDL